MTNTKPDPLSPEPEASDRRAVLRNALAAAAALGTFAPRVQAFTPSAGSGYLPVDNIEPSIPLVGAGYCAHDVQSAGVGCSSPFVVGMEVCVDCASSTCAPHNGGALRTYRRRNSCGSGVTCTGTWTPANGGSATCGACGSGNTGWAYC